MNYAKNIILQCISLYRILEAPQILSYSYHIETSFEYVCDYVFPQLNKVKHEIKERIKLIYLKTLDLRAIKTCSDLSCTLFNTF